MIAHVLHACAILSLPSTSQLSTCRPVNLSTFRPVDRSTCRPVDLTTCLPVNLSTCRPVTSNMAIYGVCILLRGSGGLAPRHSVGNQCLHACAILSLPLTSQLSTCRPFNLSSCRPVTCNMAIYGVCILL